jgi:hypothetical protein
MYRNPGSLDASNLHIADGTSVLKDSAMQQRQNLVSQSNSHLPGNVCSKLTCVKSIASKIASYSLKLFVSASLALGVAAVAHAEDNNERAMVNSTMMLNMLNGVDDNTEHTHALDRMVSNIDSGLVHRYVPKYPVWILRSDTGTLLYYQGEKTFGGQDAARLVDDKGFRFGQRAVDQARNSRSTWVTLSLGGQNYRAYCGSKQPFVVCTLIK